jgi:hypothetical protein
MLFMDNKDDKMIKEYGDKFKAMPDTERKTEALHMLNNMMLILSAILDENGGKISVSNETFEKASINYGLIATNENGILTFRKTNSMVDNQD